MKMTLKLNAPGMTSLHKAGLAGLYMTLRAFEETNQKIEGLNWELEPTQVILDWQDQRPGKAFQEMIKKSFWLDEGFIRLTGLEVSKPPTPDKKYDLYNALLNSFLQFGPHRPTLGKQTLTYEVGEKVCLIKNFAPIKEFRHQFAADDFINNEGNFFESIEAAGWLYPGGGQRHVVHRDTKLNEPTQLALALLFAPVGVIYYTIRSRSKGRKARLAMLIPEIKDLELYTEIRQAFARQGVFEMTASSASDAALRMFTTIEANQASNTFAQFLDESSVCRVITFGIVGWNEKQKSRTYAHSVISGRLPGLENYAKAAAIFKNRWQLSGQDKNHESYFIIGSTAREIIADNIAQSEVWYHDLATFLTNKETRKGLSFERKELNQMIEQASFDDKRKSRFISVCHESWRKRMGKLSDRASKGGGYRRDLIQKEFEKLRTALLRSRNSQTLRQTVVDLWARAGLNNDLQGQGLRELLPLFNEENWRETRDLALLALISYQPKDPEEAEALTTESADGGEENK